MSSIDDHLTHDIIVQLYFYTQRKIAKLQQSPINLNIKATDIVNKAIYQTITNKTPWNEKSCPKIFVHLASNVKDILHKEVCFDDKNENKKKDKKINDDFDFTPEELQLAFSKFKIMINYLHENKEELIKDAEEKLLNNPSLR